MIRSNRMVYAALGAVFLSFPTSVQADDVAPTAENVELEDCAAAATRAKRALLSDQLNAHGVARSEAAAWMRAQTRDPEFVKALNAQGGDAYNDCTLANLRRVREAQEQEIAALDQRIAAAGEILAQHGFFLRKSEEGDMGLYRQTPEGTEYLAAHLTQESQTGEWRLDFAPLRRANAELRSQTEQTRAHTDRRRENIRQMEDRIREIWRGFERGESIRTDG